MAKRSKKPSKKKSAKKSSKSRKSRKVSSPKARVKSSKTIAHHYEQERSKIKANLHQLEIAKVREYIKLAEQEYVRVRQKSQHLETMHRDIIKKISDLNKKIKSVRRKKKDRQDAAIELTRLRQTLSGLEDQQKAIRKDRAELIARERKVMQNIHRIVGKKTAELYSLRRYTPKFNAVEKSKGYLLSESQHLVEKELGILDEDLNIMDAVSSKVASQIQKVNKQLKALLEKKKNLLWKDEMLGFSEESTKKKLEEIRSKYKQLEKKLASLLKKS